MLGISNDCAYVDVDIRHEAYPHKIVFFQSKYNKFTLACDIDTGEILSKTKDEKFHMGNPYVRAVYSAARRYKNSRKLRA